MGHTAPRSCICGIPVMDLPPDHTCLKAPPREPSPKDLALHDLRYLLSFPKLGAWGMETLIDTLHVLIPELREPSPDAPPSPTVE